MTLREQFVDLVRRSFELYVQKRWLSVINKEVNKYNRINNRYNKLVSKLNKQRYVIEVLLTEYNTKYDSDLKLGGYKS